MRLSGANLLLLLSAILVAVFVASSAGLIDATSVPVSEFKDMVSRNEVKDATFEGDVVTATVVEGTDAAPRPIRTVVVPGDDSLVPCSTPTPSRTARCSRPAAAAAR